MSNQELNPVKHLSRREKTERRLYQVSFRRFIAEALPVVQHVDFIPNWHIDLLASHLTGVYKELIKRLLVNVPPSTTKSTIVNVLFPAWVFANDPKKRFACFTWSDELNGRDSDLCRDLINSDWYQHYFPDVHIKHGSDRRLFFELESGGWRASGTPGSKVGTGVHPRYVLIDDAQSREQAQSRAMRESVGNWYFGTLSSRGLGLDAAHVVSQQRLNRRDLSGWILEHHKELLRDFGESPWYHIRLPMRYKSRLAMKDQGFGGDPRTIEGELLFPAFLDEKKVVSLERSLRALGPGEPAAQLDQDPQMVDGKLFKASKIRVIDPKDPEESERIPEEFDAIVRAWDKAATDGAGCYSVGVLMAKKGDRFYILDIVRAQVGADELIDLMKSTIAIDEARYGLKVVTYYEAEGGSSGPMVDAHLRKVFRGHRFFPAKPMGNASKEVKVQSFASAVGHGEVYILAGKYVVDFIDELAEFPEGDYLDQADAASLAYLALTVPELFGGSSGSGLVLARDGSTANVPPMGSLKPCWGCQVIHGFESPRIRPAWGDDGYCCAGCRASHESGSLDAVHTPECNHKSADWRNRAD